MTVSALNAADPAIVTGAHLTCILDCSGATLNRHIAAGQVPRPDERGRGAKKLWRLSTIRAWRPDLEADLAAMASRKPAKLILLAA